MSEEPTQQESEPTEESTQATEAVHTKDSGRSQRSDKQKAALACAEEINEWAAKHNLAVVQESYYRLFENKKSA